MEAFDSNMLVPLTDLLSFLVLSALMQQSLYAAVLLVPALMLGYLLRRASPVFLMAVWGIVLCRLFVPPWYDSPFSFRALVDVVLASDPLTVPMLTRSQLVSWFSQPLWQGFPYLRWNLFALLCWLLPSLVLLLRYSGKRRVFHRVTQQEACQEYELLLLVECWRRKLHIRRRIKLVLSSEASGPFTLGVIFPVVVLPRRLVERLPMDELEAVIAHELTHVCRYDDFWIRFEQLLSCLFFFHPATWLCRRYLRRLREMVCDRIVLATKLISPRVYAGSLLSVIELCGPQEGVAVASAYTGSYAECRQRIEWMEGHQSAKTLRELYLLLAILFFSALVVLPMAPTLSTSELRMQPPATVVVSSDLRLSTVVPIAGGKLSSFFGPRDTGNSGWGVFGRGRHFHTGVDIVAARGDNVVSVLGGIVEKAVTAYSDEMSMVGGGYVIVNHGDGLRSVYNPLENILVKPEQVIGAGVVIGQLGRTIVSSPGDHLHLELSKDEQVVDPRQAIDFSQAIE